MPITIYSNLDTLSHEAARLVVRLAEESITKNGRFTFALSGGSTPKRLYSLLAQEPYLSQIDWAHVDIFWSDERCVPPDDAESNYNLALQAMLSKIPIPAQQIHRMPAEQEDRNAASLAYTIEMKNVFGVGEDSIPAFDLIQLGMGPEGHTASLFPHQASLHEQQRLIMPVTVPKPPPPRLTFTPRLLNEAHYILFLVTGAEKTDAVQAVLEGEYQPDEYPAQLVRPPKGEVIWMLDTGAAAKLQKQYTQV